MNDSISEQDLTLDDTNAPDFSRAAARTRVYMIRPANGKGVRFVRARSRAAAREHVTRGLLVDVASVEDLAQHMHEGIPVEDESRPLHSYVTLRAFSIPGKGGES